jgi:(2Fe-2S) ferredoxin
MRYNKHIFICINQRSNDRKSCGENHGLQLVASFKKELKERGLNVKVRAQKAGCIDACDFGPSLVIYPEGVFYGNVQLENVIEIIEKHIIGNMPVKHLMIDFKNARLGME